MELKQGLQRIGGFDTEAARWQAEQAGFATFVLPANGIVDRASFFDAVRGTFPLNPPVISCNWNGLSDSLCEGLSEHPARSIAILWPNTGPMSRSASSDFEIALSVLAYVAHLLADVQATCGNPKRVAVLVE